MFEIETIRKAEILLTSKIYCNTVERSINCDRSKTLFSNFSSTNFKCYQKIKTKNRFSFDFSNLHREKKESQKINVKKY